MKHYEKELSNSKRKLQNWNYWSMPNLRPKKKTHQEEIEEAQRIIEIVCHYYEYSYKELVGKYRGPALVMARHITMYFIKEKTKLSLVDIGEMFARDHTTIIYALRNVESKKTHPYDESVKIDLFNINLLL